KILYAEDGTPETKILATGTYSPAPNRWYAWATSQDFELMQDEYETRKYSFWIPAGEKVSEGQEAKVVSPLERIDSDTLVVDPELDANCDLVAKYHWEMTDSEYTNWKYVGDSKRYFIFYWEEDYERTHTWKENEKFYYYLNASQEIRVNIAPGKNGNVSVQSVGTLNTSSILAPHGKIELTSNSSIQTLRTSADIQSGNISLNVLSDPKYPNAGGGIGMASAPISIRQTNDAGEPLAESSILNIRADLGNVWLQNRYSDTVLNDILAADGAFTLKSQGSILQNSGKTLRAQGLTLQSDTGTIGSLTDPLRIETAVTERTQNLEGNVVLKASGDIAVREMGKADGEGFRDNPLYVEQIESTDGDVKVQAVGGDLLDGNETRDLLLTEENRAEEWLEEHGIIQGEAYEELKKDTVEAAELKLEALYHEFWKNGEAQYDPDFRFAYEETEKEKMHSVGISDEKIAESEAELTAFYHESCFDFGNAAYDPDFSRTLTEAEQEKLLAGSLREFAKLKNLLPFETYGEKASAEVPMSAVISGGKIFLETDQAIGRLKDPLVIEAGTNLHSLDESTIDILQKALPQDVSYVYGEDGNAVAMTVQLKNQLVLNASETVEVFAKSGAILGSVTDLTLDSLQVENGDLLLDVQGDLNANSTLLADSMTMNVWGNIGSKETPVRVTLQGTESTMDAWAEGGIYFASDSDLRVAHLETLSEAGIRLETASGASILAAETAYAEHIKAEALQILSDGSIGTETEPLTLAAGTEKGTVSVELFAEKEISAASKDGLTVQNAESESGSVALSANGGMNVNGEVVGHGVTLATENGDLVQSADSAIESKGAENSLTVHSGGNVVLEDAASEGELTALANGGMNVNGELVGHGVMLATENGDLVQAEGSAIESKGA
ncbi:MAG: hypothetical protein J6A23_14520, partial [Thermoguttaceae bacterium]|nr:hypothetical protein [Thermoguttaceae bacterium]